jgi:DNA polymerase-3 subunit chi
LILAQKNPVLPSMQVTFYELIATTLEKTLPKILEKVYEGGLKAVVRVEEELFKTIDSGMWTYATMGFLPHGSRNDPVEFLPHQPIWLTTGEDNPISATVLVITTQNYAADSSSVFERLVDIYDGNDIIRVQKATERMTEYKANGYEVVLWKQTLKGAWEKGR